MAARPGDSMVPHGDMRASTADRERAIDVLKAAFAEGRLDQDEYADRVGQVYTSRTYGQLAALTADLPIGPLGTMLPTPVQPMAVAPFAPPPLPEPQQTRPQTNGMAVAAVAFALGGFVTGGITSVLAVVLAIFAAAKISITGERGRGLVAAAAGVVLFQIIIFMVWH